MKCKLFLMPAGVPRCTVVVSIGVSAAHITVAPTATLAPIKNSPTTRVRNFPTSDLANRAAQRCYELLVRFPLPPQPLPTTPRGVPPAGTPRGVG